MTSTTITGGSGRSTFLLTLAFVILLAACKDGERPVTPATLTPGEGPAATVGTNSSVLLGRGTFWHPVDLERELHDWKLEIKAEPSMDVGVQRVTFPVGTNSGWHSHPGPVFVRVQKGTVTFYLANDPECKPIVRTVGQTYIETGDITHIGRNEGTEDAETLVVFFTPVGATFRIDEADPGNCHF